MTGLINFYRKHIFQDLKPYVCTFEECDLKMFADRSTWFTHELQIHRIEWCCPFCTHPPLQSLVLFEDHLQNYHAQKFIKEQLSALGATCQQSVDKISPQACPFCDEWSVKLRDANPNLAGGTLVVTPAQFQHHVGSHMEQLALFALPKDHGDAVESTGVAGGADNSADSEFGSKASYECHKNPPLHIASYEGLEDEVSQLLKDGAKVNAPGETWGNVLQAAVVGGHVSIVQLLLEYGAEVTLYGGPYGQYSLHTAMQSGEGKILRLLLEAREKTEFKSNKEVRRIYSDHEGEKQEAPKISAYRDLSQDLETRYQIALRYPRAEYTCPVCGEKFGDANQLWSQHATSRHQLSLVVTRPDDKPEVQKQLIVSAERLSHSQSQIFKRPQQILGQKDTQKRSHIETSSSTEIGVTGGSDTVLLIDSIIDISIQVKYWFRNLLPDDLTRFSDVANVKSRLPRFIDILANSKLEAKAGRFSKRLPLERDLKLLLQNLGKSLEVLIHNISTVSTAYPSGQVRTKSPSDWTGFEWICIYSSASEVYVGMDLLDLALRKFPVTPVQSTDSLETSQSKVLRLAVHADDLGNTKDTQDPEDAEAEADDGLLLAAHIRSVIKKAIDINFMLRMVHCSEASTSSDAITSIHQNLLQIIQTLRKTLEQAQLGTYTIVLKAPLVNLLDKLRPTLGNVERLFGSDEHRQARQSSNDPHAEEVQRLSEMIEAISVDIRKHESEISTVSGMRESLLSSLETDAGLASSSSDKKDKEERPNKWLYMDIYNKLKGPWSDAQMYAWYEAGYLPRGLYIREVDDTDFQPLSRMIGRIEKIQSENSTPLLQAPPGLITKKTFPQFIAREDILPIITRFMKDNNLSFDPYPIIEGNGIDVAELFFLVITNGGSKRIAVEQAWGAVAIMVGLPTEKCPDAPEELESYWIQNLLEYEESLEAQPLEQR